MLQKYWFGLLPWLHSAQVGGKLRWCWVGCKRWLLVVVLTVKTLSPAYAEGVFSFLDGDEEAPEPPQLNTYQLPTLNGSPPTIDDRIEPLIKAPSIDADALFGTAMNCYPQKSKWAIDVELRGSVASASVISDNGTDLGRNYVQIVASMPLYSAKEMDRAMKNEHDLRTETAKLVADFVSAIADRNHAMRELALYESLEARAAVRVMQGVVSANEQVTYLEKVAKAQKSVIKANADIMADRLALVALCSVDKQERMNTYLKQVSALPKGDE